jgi:hypothetical protein
MRLKAFHPPAYYPDLTSTFHLQVAVSALNYA